MAAEFNSWNSLLRRKLVFQRNDEREIMLGWALTFLIIAIIAAIFGFGGIAEVSADIAIILFVIFFVLFIIAALVHALRGRKPPV